MQINEAINVISDGHTIWRIAYAKRVCKALGVPFNEAELVETFHSEADYKGAHMKEGCEGSLGVYSLTLSQYVAEQLGVAGQAIGYLGRGFQAREYARLVAEKLKVKV